MLQQIVQLFLLFCCFSFSLAQNNETDISAQNNETTVKPHSLGEAILSSVPFQNYEAFCPNDSPVRIFQYKQIKIETERDALLFNASTWPNDDMLLKAVCFDVSKFFGKEWVNVSTPECRFGDAFIAGHTVWDNDPKVMCTRDEYVNGVSSEYVNGTRWLKVRCCKIEQFQPVADYQCYNVPTDLYGEYLMHDRLNCSLDLLNSVTVSRTSSYHVGVVARYCGYERKGFKSDPYCAAKRRVEIIRSSRVQKAPNDEQWASIDAEYIERRFEPGSKTPAGGTFDFSCPANEAINRIDVQVVSDDLLFTFFCNNLTEGAQAGQTVRYTDYQPLPTTDDVSAGCDFRRDEVLCGVKSYVSPRATDPQSARLYSFACCIMDNARVNDAQEEQIRGITLAVEPPNEHLQGSSQARGQFLHRFHVEYASATPDNSTSVITAWSAYEYLNQPTRRSNIVFGSVASNMRGMLGYALFQVIIATILLIIQNY